MIKNERQYRITKAQAAKFESAIAALGSDSKHRNLRPILRKAERDALEGQLESLQAEIHEYDSLVGTKEISMEVALKDLPSVLIRARIAMGLTQQQLANRLGLDAQQIQRYEATGYGGANLEKIASVADVLGLTMTVATNTKNS